MVLPLLGILGLGAGLAAKPYYDRWAEGIETRGRAKRMEEGMGGLLDDPEASQLDIGKQLLRTGNVSGSEFLSGAFDQENLLQGFGLDQLLANQGARRDQAGVLEGRLFDLDKEFQPRFDALDQRFGRLEGMGTLLGDISGVMERDGVTGFGNWMGTPEGQQAWTQLSELGAEDYFTWERALTGGAEPNEGTRKELREAYDIMSKLSGTTSPIGESGQFIVKPGQVRRAADIVGRRLEDVRRETQAVRDEYQRNQDRVTQGGAMIPGRLLGDVGVGTRSDRNLIQSESGGNWGATNDEGMLGRAQFSPDRLDEARAAGALPPGVSGEDFLASPQIQQRVEDWHWRDIENFMEANELDALEGSEVLGIPVTWQGMLNVAHLGGKNGLARFLATKGRYNPADSNGTRLSDYLAMGARRG